MQFIQMCWGYDLYESFDVLIQVVVYYVGIVDVYLGIFVVFELEDLGVFQVVVQNVVYVDCFVQFFDVWLEGVDVVYYDIYWYVCLVGVIQGVDDGFVDY